MKSHSGPQKRTSKKHLPLLIIIFLLIISLAIALKPKPAFTPLPLQASVLAAENSILIDQIPEKIYPFVADLKNGWPQWSAFNPKDDEIQYVYSPVTSGRGSTRSWISAKYGNGTQTITNANPKQGVSFEITLSDRKSSLSGNLAFKPVGSSTRVTWIDSDEDHSVNGYMETIMGQNIQESLVKLKAVSEALWKHPK